MRNNRHYRHKPNRLPKKKSPPFTQRAVGALAIASGSMLGFALPNLLNGSGPLVMAKTVLIAGTAAGVAYSVNRLAVERGAPLTAIGFVGAGAVSVLSMAVVGGGLFAATYSGFVFKDVAELQLQDHATAITRFVGYRNRMAVEAGRVVPAIRSIVSDLDKKAQCEVRESCISLKGQGGRGPVARELEEKSARARIITEQLEAGESARKSALSELNRLIAEYQRILGDTGEDIWDRRLSLQKLDAKIDQVLSSLDEAVPIVLLKSYINELKRGAMIPERPIATRKLNEILIGHSRSLESVVETIDRGDQTRPAFPRRTGVADTFRFLGHFAPIALITAVVELVFPLTLWLYSFLTLYWKNYRDDPPAPDEDGDEDGFGGLINLRSSTPKTNTKITNIPTRGNSRKRGASRHTPRRR